MFILIPYRSLPYSACILIRKGPLSSFTEAFLTLPTFSIPFVFITYGPLCSFADDIPNWPTLVVPSLACSVTSLFPSDTAFKILLAVATAFFVFDASGKNLLPYYAKNLLREILRERNLVRDIFRETSSEIGLP